MKAIIQITWSYKQWEIKERQLSLLCMWTCVHFLTKIRGCDWTQNAPCPSTLWKLPREEQKPSKDLPVRVPRLTWFQHLVPREKARGQKRKRQGKVNMWRRRTGALCSHSCVFPFWSRLGLQHCVTFRDTAEWLSYTYTDTFLFISSLIMLYHRNIAYGSVCYTARPYCVSLIFISEYNSLSDGCNFWLSILHWDIAS